MLSAKHHSLLARLACRLGGVGYTQFWCVDLTANPLHLTTSDAYRTTVGGWRLW